MYFFFKFDSIRANTIASFYNERYLKHLKYVLSIQNDKDLYNHLFENFYNSESGKQIVKSLNYNLSSGVTIEDIKEGKFFKKSGKYAKTNIMKILMTMKIARNFPLEDIYEYLEYKHNIKISKREKVVIKNSRKYYEKKFLEKNPPKYIDTQYLILFPDFKNIKYHEEAVKLYSYFLLEKLNYENKLNSLFNEYFLKNNRNNLLIAIDAYEDFKNFMTKTLTKIVVIFLKSRGIYDYLSKYMNIEEFINNIIYDLFFKEFEQTIEANEDEESDDKTNKFKNVSEGNFDLFISKINAFNIEDFYKILETVKKDINESMTKLNIRNEKIEKLVIEPFYEQYYRLIDFKQFSRQFSRGYRT